MYVSKLLLVLCCIYECGDCILEEFEFWKKDIGMDLGKDYVGRDFKVKVGDEEDEDNDWILVWGEVKVLFKIISFCIFVYCVSYFVLV